MYGPYGKTHGLYNGPYTVYSSSYMVPTQALMIRTAHVKFFAGTSTHEVHLSHGPYKNTCETRCSREADGSALPWIGFDAVLCRSGPDRGPLRQRIASTEDGARFFLENAQPQTQGQGSS